ncbi:hypothetical protein M0813_03210 [Anaeramoeba flamelloides]|uniref:Uncharacterized protein n=1 Tax=Anaeramoeba flamelloides TaxID=1746091 RepID=A0ABQ8Y1A8_9EUKA|nr:hypothetical protein M0813_03210 [Anaeramoeba flamelloides]
MEGYQQVQELIKDLRMNKANTELVIEYLKRLNNLANETNDSIHQSIRENSAIRVILSIIQGHAGNQVVVEKAFGALRSIASSKINWDLLGIEGVFVVAKQFLDLDRGNEKVVGNILGLFWNSSLGDVNWRQISGTGTIRSILNAFSFFEHAELRFRAIQSFIGFSNSKDLSKEIIDEGGVSLILKALQYSTQEDTKLLDVILTLFNNLSIDDVNCIILGTSGVIEFVLQILHGKNRNNEKFILKCFGVLGNLACNVLNNELLIQRGCLNDGIEILQQPVRVSNRELIEKVMLLFANLSISDHFTKEIQSISGFEKIVAIMKKTVRYETIQKRLLAVLINLTTNQTAQVLLYDNGIIPPLLTTTISYLTKPEIMQRALNVLYHLSQNEKANDAIGVEGGIGLIFQNLKKYKNNQDIVDLSALALVNLSTNPDNRKRILRHDGENVLKGLMNPYSNENDIYQNILKVLNNLQL